MPSVRLSAPPTKHLFLTAALCALLAACGGGDDDASTPTAAPSAPPPPAAPVPAAPTFAACFTVTPGVAYTMTDPDGGGSGKVLMVNEAFDGSARAGSVEFVGTTDVRSAATYWSPESNGIRFWGSVDYDATGAAQSKHVHSPEFLLPLSLQAGQSTVLKYTDTTQQLTGAQAGQTDTEAFEETWTFEGFETLTLGGKTFTDTCRVRTLAASAGEDGPSTLWFAKGSGVIRVRHTNSAGQVVEESSLDAVTAQP